MQISFEELYSGQMLCHLLDQPWWCHLLDQPWWKMQRFLIYPLEFLLLRRHHSRRILRHLCLLDRFERQRLRPVIDHADVTMMQLIPWEMDVKDALKVIKTNGLA